MNTLCYDAFLQVLGAKLVNLFSLLYLLLTSDLWVGCVVHCRSGNTQGYGVLL